MMKKKHIMEVMKKVIKDIKLTTDGREDKTLALEKFDTIKQQKEEEIKTTK